MIRRLIVIPAWMVGAAVAVNAPLAFLVDWLISPGLGDDGTAEAAAAMGIVTLAMVASIYVGVLGYRGRLPGTSRRETPVEPKEGGRGFMGRVFAALGIVLVASAVSAIVASAVVTNYVTEYSERRERAGEVDWIITVESEVLRETRDLRVLLPEDYDTDQDKRYPVLLTLDGGWNLDHTAFTAQTLERLGLGEPMIVVGVINGVAGRGADFVPPGSRYGPVPSRADRFLEFLETEALPRIDRDLRTDSTRLIAGHSLGGLFVTYSLVQRPDLFTGRLAFSPSLWVGDEAMVSEMERFLGDSPELNSYLYTSLGSRESGGMHSGFNALIALLEEGAPPGLHWQAEILSGADHGNNAVRSTPLALRGFWEYWGAVTPGG